MYCGTHNIRWTGVLYSCYAVQSGLMARTCRLVVEERSAWQHSLSVFMQSQLLDHSLSNVLCDSIQESDSRLIKSGPAWPLSRLWLGYRVTAVMRLVSDSGQWGVRAVSWLVPMCDCDEISSDWHPASADIDTSHRHKEEFKQIFEWPLRFSHEIIHS